ncbi:transposase [Brachybacterium sp. Marseille-Q7125]|uniref:transposase n=1 Tax=Brachybacterium sp. Marseille-Q7125 TaxID=2932815 RepID=UPI001FF3F330|nr:transposase [Brachybacterium sp. Marseille-Q7125]
MPAPRKYPDELRERAVRMVLDALDDDSTSQRGVFRRVGERLGVNPETLRGWVRQRQIDAGERPGTTTVETERIRELEQEVRELRRANSILRTASAFFASVPD